MDILFLGTSSGTPTKTRNVTGIAVLEEKGRTWYLIDCGEGTQHQLLHTNLSLNELQAIFITHVHGDHCYGLPGLLASAGMNGRKAPLKIVAPKGIEAWFLSTQQQTQLYLPFEVKFIETETFQNTNFGSFVVSSIELSHRVPSFSYIFTEANVETNLDSEKLILNCIPQGPLWGKIKKGLDVEYEGHIIYAKEYVKVDCIPRKVIICGDNDSPELLTEASKNCHVIVHEATYTIDIAKKIGESVGHSFAELIASFSEKASIPNLILTHFSPRYQSNTEISPSIKDIYNEASSVYKGNLFIAEDFYRYRLKKSGDFALVENS